MLGLLVDWRFSGWAGSRPLEFSRGCAAAAPPTASRASHTSRPPPRIPVSTQISPLHYVVAARQWMMPFPAPPAKTRPRSASPARLCLARQELCTAPDLPRISPTNLAPKPCARLPVLGPSADLRFRAESWRGTAPTPLDRRHLARRTSQDVALAAAALLAPRAPGREPLLEGPRRPRPRQTPYPLAINVRRGPLIDRQDLDTTRSAAKIPNRPRSMPARPQATTPSSSSSPSAPRRAKHRTTEADGRE